ncbi:MAG: AZOBR_p60025 family cell surface glycopolymer formation protein [Anaerolineae bacterium]
MKWMFLNPGWLALLICCLIVALVYFAHDCDPLAFVIMGSRFAQADPSGAMGYDGQFAYYIAKDPVGALAHLDNPSYRYQRILYPFLARLLAIGEPALIPWTLLLINIVSITLSTELLGRMLGRYGLHPYIALLLPLWLGQIFALRADLNEPLCIFLVVVALWWYEKDQVLLSAIAMTASVLAKEIGLLFLPAVVLVELLRRRWRVVLFYTLPVVLVVAILQVWLYLWVGRPGFNRLSDRFEIIPFYGFICAQPLAARVFLILIFAVPVAALLVLAVFHLVRTWRSVYAWSLLTNCLMIAFLARLSTNDMLAVFRVATGLVVAALLFCAAHRLRRLALVLCAIWLPPSILAVMIPGFL